MTTTISGRGCRIEVALTFDSAISPTAVSKANPAVATLTSHTVETGDVGYWVVTDGMIELNEQAVYCTNTDANTFTMNGLNSTSYGTYSDGDLFLAATWATISESAAWNIPNATPEAQDDTRILDTQRRNVAGLMGAQDLTIDIRNAVINSTAMAFIEAASASGSGVLIRISKGTNVLRVVYGTPGRAGEAVSAGGLASGQLTIIVPRIPLKPNV